MNRFWIPVLAASAVFSANAFAHHDCDDDDARYERRYRESVRREVVYEQPAVVYREAPRAVYRERIEYRERPVYYREYREPAVRYYEPPRRYSGYDERAYRHDDGNRAVGQVVGAIAGGLIGNQIGQGGGRIAATAVGAVLGGVVGGELAERSY